MYLIHILDLYKHSQTEDKKTDEERSGCAQDPTNSKQHRYDAKHLFLFILLNFLPVLLPLYLMGRKSEKDMLLEFSPEEGCLCRVM